MKKKYLIAILYFIAVILVYVLNINPSIIYLSIALVVGVVCTVIILLVSKNKE